MRIRLTKPEHLDEVLDRLDQQWPLGKYNDTFIEYCVPAIKERLAKGETIYLESEIDATHYGVCQILSYWYPDDIPTDEDYLNSFEQDESE